MKRFIRKSGLLLRSPALRRLIPFLLILFFCTAFPLAAEKIKPFVMPSARAAGFGGIHAAQGDDFSSIFSNPASFAGMERQWSAAELTVSVYGPVFDILDAVTTGSGDITSVIDSYSDFAAGADIGGPFALGLVSNGFGIGFFNRSVADIETKEISIPGKPAFLLVPSAWEEVLLVGGYSFRVVDKVEHTLDIGILGKGFYRTMLRFDLPDNYANLLDMVFDSEITVPLDTHFGFGFDLGFKYSFDDRLSLALAGYDVFSPALVTKYADYSDYGDGGAAQSYAYVQPRLALGVLYRIRNEFLERYINDCVVMADYRDFINLFEDDRRHPILNLSLGAEITMLKVLRLRVGMAEALPSAGFGIDMTFMTIDMAVRGRQMGKDPGEKTVFAFDLGLLFRY